MKFRKEVTLKALHKLKITKAVVDFSQSAALRYTADNIKVWVNDGQNTRSLLCSLNERDQSTSLDLVFQKGVTITLSWDCNASFPASNTVVHLTGYYITNY